MSLTQTGLDFINTVSDPFGQGKQGRKIERYPDGDARQTDIAVFHGRAGISGALATGAIVQLLGYGVSGETAQASLVLTHGSLVSDPASTNSAVVVYTDDESATAGKMYPATAKFRCLSAGVRVLPQPEGHYTLVPFQSDKCGRTAAATYVTNGTVTKAGPFPTYSAQQGIVVRRQFDPLQMSFITVGTGTFFADGLLPNGTMPGFYYTGAVGTDVINVEWEYVMEVLPATPTASLKSVSGFEPNLAAMNYFIAATPWHSKGNSFKSVVKAIWSAARDSSRWILDNTETVNFLLKVAAGTA